MMMGRRPSKLPVVSAIAAHTFLISASEWVRIEGAIGCPLFPGVREQVRGTTEEFLEHAVCEQKAEPKDRAYQAINAIKEPAEYLHVAVREALRTGKPDADNHGLGLITKHFVNAWPIEDDGYIRAELDDAELFKEALNQGSKFTGEWLGDTSLLTKLLISACQAALEELDNRRGFRTGDAWDIWIGRLTRIAENNNLPTGTRESTDSAPFVNFIWVLQECIPEQYRRSTTSPEALAKAISRARTRDNS